MNFLSNFFSYFFFLGTIVVWSTWNTVIHAQIRVHPVTPFPYADPYTYQNPTDPYFHKNRPTKISVPQELEGSWKASSSIVENKLAYFLKVDLKQNKINFQFFVPFIVDLIKNEKKNNQNSKIDTSLLRPYGFNLKIKEIFSSDSDLKDQIVFTKNSFQINFGFSRYSPSKRKRKKLMPNLPIKDGFIKVTKAEERVLMSYYIVLDWEKLHQHGVADEQLRHLQPYYEQMRIPLLPIYNPPDWLLGAWGSNMYFREILIFSKQKIEFIYQNQISPLNHFFDFLSFNETIDSSKYIIQNRHIYLEINKNFKYYFFDKVNKQELRGHLQKISLKFVYR